MKEHTKIHIVLIALALLFSIFLTLLLLPKAIAPNVIGSNHKNVTVTTTVNITNSKPDMLNVSVYEAINASNRNITINAGTTKTVYCNGTVRNWNGFNDITRVHGVLWHNLTSSYNGTNDSNSHYTNSTCWMNASLSAITGWYVCGFEVLYYANNGTWLCNMTVENTYTATNPNFTGSAYNTTFFFPVYALNVTDGIDYGNVAVEDFSTDKTANLTNLGNMAINISVEGYGVTRGDGLAMNCSLSGNITVANERFSATSGVAYASKTSLTSTLGGVLIPALTMTKQINDTQVVNATYWQLYIPPNPAGNCTGRVIFTALAP